MSVVVSDTSPLHYLILCEAVFVLPRLFEEVVIPPTVFRELQQPNTPAPVRAWVQGRPAWVRMQAPAAIDFSLNIDPGEREAICLAREIGAAALLMDDRAGRMVAHRLGLRVTGTLGLLEQAAVREMIELPAVIERLQRTNARLDDELVQGALARDAARRERERTERLKPGPEPEP